MFFDETNEIPPDPIFGLIEAFRKDPKKEKINLLAGIYKDEEGKAELFHSAQKARELISSNDISADYLPIDGLQEFLDLLGSLLFSQKLWNTSKEKIYAAQTPGGTGALKLAADLLKQEVSSLIYLPNHTWPNHPNVFQKAGFELKSYPYYSKERRGFDFQKTADFFKGLEKGSIILLHACCHNPTGSDPSESEWRTLCQIIQEKKLFPLFDIAYQGLGEGVDQDARSIRLFLEAGMEMAIAYSCSKNFSMYSERVGALFIASQKKKIIASQIKKIIRSLYSNPPSHGAKMVAQILKDPSLSTMWIEDLQKVRARIENTREELIHLLQKKAKGIDFLYLKKHRGMFSFVDMTPEQVDRMKEEFSIYMTRDGRLSISGLNRNNLDKVASSLAVVCAKT